MSSKALAWVAADTLNSPYPTCISSLAYMSQLDRERGREYVPLYAAPVAAQKADDARDAERYRWLRDEAICFPYDVEIESAWCVFGLNCSGSDPRPIEGRELDEAIDAARRFAETDAAMAAQPQGEEVR